MYLQAFFILIFAASEGTGLSSVIKDLDERPSCAVFVVFLSNWESST